MTMESFMNKALALGFALLMPFGFTYADKQPKPNKKQRQQDIQRFIQLANNPDRSNALAPVLTAWRPTIVRMHSMPETPSPSRKPIDRTNGSLI